MRALVFLIQKVALIEASTHWVWVSIQGVNALTGLGVVPPWCVLSVRERWYYYIIYNFILYILYIIYIYLWVVLRMERRASHKCPG